MLGAATSPVSPSVEPCPDFPAFSAFSEEPASRLPPVAAQKKHRTGGHVTYVTCVHAFSLHQQLSQVINTMAVKPGF